MNRPPEWNWKPVDVVNLKKIQDQLAPIIPIVIKDWETAPSRAVHVDISLIKEYSPDYIKLLSDLNLLDRWSTSKLVTTNQGDCLPIHTDVKDFNKRCMAFNIPLINCEDSYTIWYDVRELLEDEKHYNGDYTNISETLFFNNATAIEIDRMPATTCAFVNVYRPHRPVSLHNNFRAILSSRFNPELFDYF